MSESNVTKPDARRKAIPETLRGACIAFLLLSLALLATYNHIFLGNQNDLAGGYDVYRSTGPLSYFMDYSIHHGEIPLWNPLTLCGMPFAANPVTVFFYPGNLLRSLLSFSPSPLKTQVGWVCLIGIHVLLASMGVFLLGRAHRLSRPASLTASVIFIFSAIWTRRLCEYHFICTVAWLPILLVLIRRAMETQTFRQKLRYALFGGIMFGLALLTGAANIMPYFGLTLGVYAGLYRLTRLRKDDSGRPLRFTKTIRGDAVFFCVLFMIGVLIASAFLLPGSEFSGFSSRAKSSDYELPHPAYHGTPRELYQTLIRFPGLKWEVENIRGAGIAALLLAMAGLTCRRWRETVLFAGLFLVMFDASLGRPFPIATLVERLSPIQLIASTRAFDFALMPFGLLAGLGVDTLTDAGTGRVGRWMRAIVLLGFGGLFLLSLSGLIGPGTFLAPTQFVLLIPALALAAMIAATFLPGRMWWRIALLGLVFAETWVWNVKYIPFIVDSKGFTQRVGRPTGATQFWSDNRRGTDPVQNRHLYSLMPAMHGYEPVHISRVRQVLAGDARRRSYQRSVKDYEITRENNRGNLLMKRAFWLTRQYVNGPLRNKDSLFPPTTTVYLREAPNDLPVPRVEDRDVPKEGVSSEAREIHFLTDEQMNGFRQRLRTRTEKQVLTLRNVELPPLHSVLCLRFSSTDNVIFRSEFTDLSSGRVQGGKTAAIGPRRGGKTVFHLPLPDFPRLEARITVESGGRGAGIELEDICLLVDEADEDRLMKIVSRTADTCEVEVGELPVSRILVYLDAAYPGWNAYVDGRPTPIMLADDAFKAVVVPPGTHRVRFEFRPKTVYLGAVISLTTFIGVLLALVFLAHKRPLDEREE